MEDGVFIELDGTRHTILLSNYIKTPSSINLTAFIFTQIFNS